MTLPKYNAAQMSTMLLYIFEIFVIKTSYDKAENNKMKFSSE
jgi:hypothetical protein